MPVMGPSQEYAYGRGEEAYGDVLKLLKEKYGADRPPALGNARGFEKRVIKNWDDKAEELKEILKELVWISDAGSF